MVLHKDIIYPYFLECCKYTTDMYWSNIFEDLAYGKTPYGSYISKDFLYCNYKDREFAYKILKKDSKELYEEVYSLFTNKLGLLSDTEKTQRKQEFIDIENSLNINKKSWVDIKKKNMKDLLLEMYVINMGKKYELSTKQCRYLLSVLFLALILKVIVSKDIQYEDGHVTNISGIEFQKHKIILKRDLYNFDYIVSPEIIVDKNLMSDNWKKYIGNLVKITA